VKKVACFAIYASGVAPPRSPPSHTRHIGIRHRGDERSIQWIVQRPPDRHSVGPWITLRIPTRVGRFRTRRRGRSLSNTEGIQPGKLRSRMATRVPGRNVIADFGQRVTAA